MGHPTVDDVGGADSGSESGKDRLELGDHPSGHVSALYQFLHLLGRALRY